MEIKQRIRELLGIDEIRADITLIFEDVEKIHQQNKEIYDACLRLRILLVEKFDQNKPASIEGIDAIFRETRDRLDVVMITLDSFKDAMERRR